MYNKRPYPSQVRRKMGMGQYKKGNISAVSTAPVSQISESRPSGDISAQVKLGHFGHRARWPRSLLAHRASATSLLVLLHVAMISDTANIS